MIGGLEAFIDAHSAVVGLLILALMFFEFLRERYSVAVVALLGACAFIITGLLEADRFFSVFSNTAPIAIGAMFILSGALVRTGTIDAIASAIVARASRHPRLALVEVFGGILIASAFMNNTPVVLILIPVMFRLAAATGIPVKRLLMPLSIVAILGGCLTLIGTSTNLVVAGLVEEAGLPRLGIFSITPYGAAAALAGCAALVLLAPFLLPSDEPHTGAVDPANPAEFLSELTLRRSSPIVGKKVAAAPPLRRRLHQIRAIARAGQLIRRNLDEVQLKAGDRIILRGSAVDLLTLRRGRDFDVGIVRTAAAPDPEETVVETMISPSHPSIGGRLAEIPFLNRLNVRVLGIMRFKHLPGPDLASARIRAADRLLVAGGPDAIQGLRDNPHLLGVSASRKRAFRPDLAPIAIAALAGTILISAFNVAPIAVAAVVGVGIILLFRCIDPVEAWSSIDGDVLILIFAMLAVGAGLEQAGSIALIIDALTPLLRDAPPWMLVFLVYATGLTLSELLSNNAVAAILTPMVIELARDLGADPYPLILALMISASACFSTPIGYQTNALVYAAGGYRFSQFARMGLPLDLIVGLAACTAIVFFA
ncbi:MAG: SLC13 family permease [Pseudomonadota bacterium]|nr:SLC13 family permease [Pseudomonadota bacterium]